MSGDSDFVELIRHIKSEGVRVEIAAIKNTTNHISLKVSILVPLSFPSRKLDIPFLSNFCSAIYIFLNLITHF